MDSRAQLGMENRSIPPFWVVSGWMIYIHYQKALNDIEIWE